MKIILLSLFVLFVLIFAGLFVFIKALDVNKYLPPISRQIGNTIHRNVSIGHADLDLGLKGLALQLKNITISDDPSFSHNDFLTVDSIDLGLDLTALIQKREINITKIQVDSPKISIVRVANGSINVQTMGASAEPTTAPTNSPTAANQPKNASVPIPPIVIRSVSVSHLQFSLEDQNPQMPLHVLVPDGSIEVNHFSFTQPFGFTIKLNAFSVKDNNIDITGQCSLDLTKNAVHINTLRIYSDLTQWDINKVKAMTPALKDLTVWPKGQVSIDIPGVDASAQGLQKLSLKAQLTVGTGQINADADLNGLMATPAYTFQLESKALKIENLIDQSKAQIEVKGELNGQFSGSGESFDPRHLKAQGQLSLNNGEIDKLNILKTILGALNGIPAIGGALQERAQAALPPNLQGDLNSDTTVLNKAEGQIKIENKTISIESADVESKLFSISATGAVNFDLNADIDVKTYLSAEISSALVKSTQPLQSLLDEQNRLYIPGRVQGKIPSVRYLPQMDDITKKVAVAEGSRQINTQLQKVFKKNPGVANILNSVFGGNS